jgi:hypothetical protein
MRHVLFCSVSLALVLTSVALWSQVQPPSVFPIPIPGGDVIAPIGVFNQFLPGEGAGLDGLNAEPHGMTNFRGSVAMGYTSGLATDTAGNSYQVITDIRVYKGEYIGAQPTFGAGGATSAKARGTFVEI